MATQPSPQKQLDRFLAKYAPEMRTQGKAVLAKMRRRLPSAVQMVYDNYNGLVVGFGPTERPSEAVLSIVLFPRWVTLFFLYGVRLADPERRLKGGGSRVRHLRLESPSTLDEPAVRSLITAAIATTAKPLDGKGPSPLLIKSISAKQRPRRPA